jgi:hypothetical protein
MSLAALRLAARRAAAGSASPSAAAAAADGGGASRLLSSAAARPGPAARLGPAPHSAGPRVAGDEAAFFHTNRLLVGATDPAGVLRLVRERGAARMNHVNVATALHVLVKRGGRPSQAGVATAASSAEDLALLTELMRSKLNTFEARSLANSLWALGTLRHFPGEATAAALEEALVRVAPELSPQHCSNVLWALGRLKRTPGAAAQAALNAALARNAADLGATDLSQALWGLGQLELSPGPAVLSQLDGALARVFAHSGDAPPRVSAQHLSNTLWGLARLGHRPSASVMLRLDEALMAIASVAAQGSTGSAPVQRVRLDSVRLEPQALSNSLWAWAVLGHRPAPAVLRVVDGAVLELLPRFRAQELSNTLWALARLGHRPADANLAALDRAVAARAAEFGQSGQALANSLWAFARLRWLPALALPRLEQAALPAALPKMSSQQLANSLEAYARFRCQAPQALLSAVASRGALEGLGAFNGEELAVSLWALAKLKGGPRGGACSVAVVGGQLVALRGPGDEGEQEPDADAADAVDAVKGASGPAEVPGPGGARAPPGAASRADFSFGMAVARLSTAAAGRVHALPPPQLAMALWAVARLGVDPGERFWSAIPAGALERCSAQEAAQALWALARVSSGRLVGNGAAAMAAEASLPFLDAALLREARDLNARAAVSVAWAWARLEHRPAEPLARALEAAVLRGAAELDLEDALTGLWAASRGGPPAGSVPALRRLEDSLERNTPVLSPAHAAWALSSLAALADGGHDVGLPALRALDAAALLRAPAMTPAERVEALVAAARLHELRAMSATRDALAPPPPPAVVGGVLELLDVEALELPSLAATLCALARSGAGLASGHAAELRPRLQQRLDAALAKRLEQVQGASYTSAAEARAAAEALWACSLLGWQWPRHRSVPLIEEKLERGAARIPAAVLARALAGALAGGRRVSPRLRQALSLSVECELRAGGTTEARRGLADALGAYARCGGELDVATRQEESQHDVHDHQNGAWECQPANKSVTAGSPPNKSSLVAPAARPTSR